MTVKEEIFPPSGPRKFLFLQGPPTRFWGELADTLAESGHAVAKINLCLADRVFWGTRPAQAYRGSRAAWQEWLRDFVLREAVTDILYYADQLPYHRAAMAVARQLGIRAWVVELGYLRPDWITLQSDGMGCASRFPRNRARVARLAEGRSDPDMTTRYSHGFATEAFHEVTFNLLMVFGRPFYPRYSSDKFYWPVLEYLSWLRELARMKRRGRDEAALRARLEAGSIHFNLVAMQMEADYQFRAASDYPRMADFLSDVITSFAAHAPADRHLVLKIHPLDSGIVDWFRMAGAMAERAGIADRVHVIRSGDLDWYVVNSAGMVVVNSTAALHGLRRAVPVCALGHAIYSIDGLTHQGGLDSFWRDPQAVDQDFARIFFRAVSGIQFRGSFYNAAGRAAAIRGICAHFAPEPVGTAQASRR